MSARNRERRRAKQKRRGNERARSGQPNHIPGTGRVVGAGGSAEGVPADDQVRGMVLAAADAFRFETEAAYERHLDGLSRLAARSAGRASIDRAIRWWAERGLDRAWVSGWQPADVVRALRRALSGAHADFLGPAVAESGGRRPEAATDERWAAQVADLRPGAPGTPSRPPLPNLAVTLEAVSLLLYLPPLPRLGTTSNRRGWRGPLSGGTGPAGKDRSGAMLERVRALLAKAESTTFPEEADALTAKAQELMARYAIDQAMVEAGGADGPAAIGAWRISVDDPYASAKSMLLHRIAMANRSRAVWCQEMGFSTVFGTRSDLEMVELLFTSLLVQATETMLRAGRSVDRSGRSRTRSFRQSFLLAYAGRIGERLSATAAEVVAEGAERHGEALLPVLAVRAEAVEDAVQSAFPGMTKRGMAINNYAGWVAGRAAAELASLASGDELAAG